MMRFARFAATRTASFVALTVRPWRRCTVPLIE